MNSLVLMKISSASLSIPLIPIILKFKRINRDYYPFIFFIILCSINDLIAAVQFHVLDKETNLNYNLYYLFEACLLTYQFKKWGNFHKSKIWFIMILLLYFLFWIIESFITKVYLSINSYYLIFYSLSLIMMSINTMCTPEKDCSSNILISPRLMICCTFILFYSIMILTETFSAYSLRTSLEFKWRMLDLLHIVNIICNASYFFAIFQLIKKPKCYTMENKVLQS